MDIVEKSAFKDMNQKLDTSAHKIKDQQNNSRLLNEK